MKVPTLLQQLAMESFKNDIQEKYWESTNYPDSKRIIIVVKNTFSLCDDILYREPSIEVIAIDTDGSKEGIDTYCEEALLCQTI